MIERSCERPRPTRKLIGTRKLAGFITATTQAVDLEFNPNALRTNPELGPKTVHETRWSRFGKIKCSDIGEEPTTTMMDGDFRVGPWLVQPARNRIVGPHGEATVKLKSMAVLVRLAQAPGQVVPKHELLDAVWGKAAVTEDVLTQSVVELRKAFQDSANDPEVIETIRRVGFRLIPNIEAAHQPADPADRSPSMFWGWALSGVLLLAVAAIGTYQFFGKAPITEPQESPSIAVLPFLNLSDDPNNEYFGDGLAEELLDRLAKVPALQVPARTSAFAFRNQNLDVRTIGQRLSVSHVLEGSVRKSGRRIRITAQLINVSSGNHEWSKVYERRLDDVFAVQDDIARAIVDELRPQIAMEEEIPVDTLNIDAYDLYLLGRHHLEQERTDRAQEFFQRAIDADESFARAYAGLAKASLVFRDTPSSFWQAGGEPLQLERADQAIRKALSLNPRLSDAHTAQAALHALRGNVQLEEKALRTALELKPDDPTAVARLAANLVAQRRYADGQLTYEKAARVDPLNANINAEMSRLVAQTQGYDAAIAYPLRLLDNDLPSPQIYQSLMSISSDFGRYDERVKWSLRLAELMPGRASVLAEVADAYMELGEFDLAKQWADRAALLSPDQALKAQARLRFVAGDLQGFEQVAQEAFDRNEPQPNQRFDLVQATVIPIYSIARLYAGDLETAAHFFERVLEESPTISRRPPHLSLYARALLARTYQRLGDEKKVESIVAESFRIAEKVKAQGIRDYPPLTRELAKAYALTGDKENALHYQLAAVKQGWRQYYLEAQGSEDPVQLLLGDDPRYQASLDAMVADLDSLRRIVRREGLARTPRETLASSVVPER